MFSCSSCRGCILFPLQASISSAPHFCPHALLCASVLEVPWENWFPGSSARGWPAHVDLLSLCHPHLGTCPGWDNMHDPIYSKESALNQETAYLVKFSRPSKTQESWTLKCLSLCEFRFIEEFLANQSTSLGWFSKSVNLSLTRMSLWSSYKVCYSCFILISSFNIFKI